MSELKATWNNIVIKVDTQKKNSHRFADGSETVLERDWNNFNQREKNPVQGVVIDDYSQYVPCGTEILFQHTCFHPTYEIYNSKQLGSSVITDKHKYFSVPKDLCFAWRELKGEWQPMPSCLITDRVWENYTGLLEIEPKLLKQRLLVKEGLHKGKIVITFKNCDYEIVFQGDNGRENYLISTKEDEVLAIDDGLTKKYKQGKILVGRTLSEAKTMQYEEA